MTSNNTWFMFSTLKRLHLSDFAALFVSGMVSGVLSGGVMNILNGYVSPEYFGLLFYYLGGSTSWTPQELYWHSVEQGLLEGLVFGCIVAAVFTGYVFFVSRAQCGFAFAVRFLPKIVGTAFVFWLIGGFNCIIIGWLFPDTLGFITDLGGTQTERLKFLWVGGSIYGVYFGSVVALICGCIWFKRSWHQSKRSSL